MTRPRSTARIARRCTLAACVLALLFAIASTATSHAATGAGATFGPSAVPASLHVVRTESGMSTTIHWAPSGHVRETQIIDLDPRDEHVVLDQWKSLIIGNGTPPTLTDVNVNRNTDVVAPDGSDMLDTDLMDAVWPFLARERAGMGKVFHFGGTGLLKATERVGAQECAGLASGVRTVYVNAATLVPVRIIERRGGKVTQDTRFASRRARTTDFAALKLPRAHAVNDEGYVRRTPAAAVKLLSFPVSMPTALPAGFRLDHTGSAKRGDTIGPEASFPSSDGLFFARWRHGLERIDFTIRGARATLATDWDTSDPFGGECESTLLTSSVRVGEHAAHYTIGEQRAPRLWWRDGSTLYTLSGPFAATQLVAIANSLVRVA